MACMYGRCRRVVGVGVRCVWRWCTVCMALVYGAMACVGTVLWRWVYVCMSFYDVT